MIISYSKQAVKFLNKQDKPTRIRIVEAIKGLPKGDVKNYRDSTAIDFEWAITVLFLIKPARYYTSKKSIIAGKYINKEVYCERC